MRKILFFLSFLAVYFGLPASSFAFNPSKLGIHILRTDEVVAAKEAVSLPSSQVSEESNSQVLGDQTAFEGESDESQNEDVWNYVTIPLVLSDLQNPQQWQDFFDTARANKIIPLVRLTTEFDSELGAWKVPTKRNIVEQIEFLSALEWPTGEKHIIVFNEVNHAKEWGGYLDPAEYTRVLRFAADWAHTEQNNFVVLPAGLDLAAPNGNKTAEAFTYLNKMRIEDPDIFEVVDIWNSHSYPNPGFASSPTRYGQNSLRGYQHELAYLKRHTGKDYQVMITETGWDETPYLSKWLSSYYAYAMQHIWSDDRVLAVTPFVLKGAPGPFAGFSFLDGNDQPTNQYHALQSALEKIVDSGTDHHVGLR